MVGSLSPGLPFEEIPPELQGPTEGVFPSVDDAAPADPDSEYSARIRGMISDAREFNAEVLAPIRENGIKFYLGLEPGLDDETGTSTIVATEARDTVLQMMPSLMRIFTGQDQTTNFIPNNEAGVPTAEQATDYVGYVFHRDNPGYMILSDVFKDGLIKAMGCVRWWTDENKEIVEEDFEGLSVEQRQFLISQPGAEQVRMEVKPGYGPSGEIIPRFSMTIRWTKRCPRHRVAAFPPDEFRINRNAVCVKDAALVGQERFATKSELMLLELPGLPEELIDQNSDFSGGDMRFSLERMLRNVGSDSPFGRDSMEPVCRFGDYYIRVDKNGDGIAELRHIRTIGDNDLIVSDEPAMRARYAICCPDPEPHSIVGHSIVELVTDLQVIKTNMLRGALDSLAQSIWPRLMGVDTLVDWDDVLNEAIGAPIRVKQIDALKQLDYRFIGSDVFNMMDRLDAIRMARTGITDQSKGLDPKALQSTTLKGIQMIVSGAQERIELVARTMASTFMVDLMSGLLQEVVDKPVPERVVQLRGKYTPVNPSQFDATMICVPNPAMGRGSDMDRFTMLNTVLQFQVQTITASPLNPLVTPMEIRNCLEDILSIAGMKNSTRYFRPIDAAAVQQFQQAVMQKENPEMVYAKAEADKVRAQVIKTMADARVKVEDVAVTDDRERDQFEANAMLKAAEIDAKYGAAVDTAAIQALWKEPRPVPGGPGATGGPVGDLGAEPGGVPAPPSAGMPAPGPKPELPSRAALGFGPPQLKPQGLPAPGPAGLLNGPPPA